MSRETARKAAIAVLCMGEEAATEVCKYLSEDHLRVLAGAISSLGSVSGGERQSVLKELAAHSELPDEDVDGLPYLRRVLDRVTGPTKATTILQNPDTSDVPFSFAADLGAAQLAALLEDEHPQTIALVLRNLRPGPAAEVIAKLRADLQVEVVHRMAATTETSVEAVHHLDASIRRLLGGSRDGWSEASSGVDSAVVVFRNLDRRTERTILDGLSETAPELAEEISSALFSFEHIFELDERAVQLVLRNLDARQIALALKGAKDQYVEVILSNLSDRAAENLKEELGMVGRVRRKDVDDAQDAFVRAVLDLVDAGELNIDESEEDYVE